MNSDQKLLSEFCGCEQKLVDVIGFVESFDDNSQDMLCAVGLTFEESTLYVLSQDDDSFVLHSNDFFIESKWTPVSFANRRPWSSAIGSPLLFAWVFVNQQGYFDGIQFEFSESTQRQSTVVQLAALGSEIRHRDVGRIEGKE